MYGGTMWSGHISKELWALDLDQLFWERVETEVGQCRNNKLCGPIHSMGHTANVISNRMICIFGHSQKYGYLDTVQEYHFGESLCKVGGFYFLAALLLLLRFWRRDTAKRASKAGNRTQHPRSTNTNL